MLPSKPVSIIALVLLIALASYAFYKHSQVKALSQLLEKKENVIAEPDKAAESRGALEKTEELSIIDDSEAQPGDEKTDAPVYPAERSKQLEREVADLKRQLEQNKNLYQGDDKKLATKLDSLAKANTALADSLYFLNEKYQKLRLNRNLYTLTNTKGEKVHYFGDMKGERAEGYGVAIWPSGEIYKGEWKNSKRHGKGIITWETGEKYVGDFSDDMRNGYGIFNSKDGQRYEGEWKADKRHGQGTLFDKSNKVVSQGVWENDSFKK